MKSLLLPTARSRALLALLFATIQYSPTSSYIVSGLPRHKQLAWLQDMTTSFIQTTPGNLSPTQVKQSHRLLNAWSQLEPPTLNHALQAETLLKRVVDERMAGNMEAQLTVQDYNCILEGWARSGSGVPAAERCEQILTEMNAHFLPNRSSFKAVLMAWRSAAEQDTTTTSSLRAQRILEHMMQLYTTGENKYACPDADCFDSVLQTLAKTNHPDAPHRTEQLLGVMEHWYETTHHAKPRATSFNAVLLAWSKQGNAARALSVLGFMEHLAATGKTPVPDKVSYSTVIMGLTKQPDSGAPHAEVLLKRVEEGYKEGNTLLVPDTILYNTVIGAWAKSGLQGSYRRARSILARQMSLYEKQPLAAFRPDVYGFTSVLAACANEKREPAKAFQVALATFQQLRNSYGPPNHVTYGTMLKCCARLTTTEDPMRAKWVKKIFNYSVQDGCVGEMVLTRLREAADGALYKELLKGVDKKDLPTEWTRNVHEKRSDIRHKKIRRTAEV